MTTGTLAAYAMELDPDDDRWNLRFLLPEFGTRWQAATPGERPALIEQELRPTHDRARSRAVIAELFGDATNR